MPDASMLSRVLAIMQIEWLHIARDRPTRSLLALVPVVQLILFGAAVNPDPRHIPIAIAGGTDGTTGRALQVISDSDHFAVVASGLAPGGAALLVERDDALVGIELPPPARFDDPDADPPVVDATDPSTVRPALAALESAFLRRALADERFGGPPPIDIEWRYNADGRTSWAIMPGLAGAVVMISMLMLGALTLVRERERGSWEGLMATPVTAGEVLLGKLLPYLAVGVLQSAAVVLLAQFLFALPIRGSLVILLAAAALAAAAYLAVGLAISAAAQSQLQAVQAAIFLYLPSMLLSGFMFPFEGMPGWAKALGNLLPLTHWVRAARGVLLRGDGAALVAREMWPVATFAALAAIAAVIAYRRRRN